MNATMSLEKIKHHPVMLKQVLSIISPQHGGTFIDCTFGGGGYSKAILKYPDTKVFAIDRDRSLEKHANELTKKFPKRFSFNLEKFSNLSKVFKTNLKPKAIIFDLGTSSYQLMDEKRGFSFNSKNYLSMQMGMNKYSAYDVVNTFDAKKLGNLIKVLGEEKDGKKIANAIVRKRNQNPIRTPEELSSIINNIKKNKKNNKNPATKTFQAIRIFVNQELTELILGLIEATKLLTKGGILIVISFHSLEDRIVKYFFNLYSNLKKNPSRYMPEDKDKSNFFKVISKKPQTPNIKEIEMNPSSRSAKLRYGIKNNSLLFFPEDFKKIFTKYFQTEGNKI